MMKTLTAAVLLALLTACVTTPPEPKVKWGTMGLGGNPVVVWHWEDDPNAACRKLSSEPPPAFARIKGCSVMRGRECHIYVPKPANEEDKLVTILHEWRHCTDGHFHDRFGREDPNQVIWR